MAGKLNMSNPAIKRIIQEAKEMTANEEDFFEAHPMEDDIFDWHFTIRGPDETPFAGGLYHGRIILPTDYPHKPPEFLFMTPTGRFEVGKKICLSISQHHPEHWQPSWGIRTALLALRSFMPTKGEGAIGSLDYTSEERSRLAHESRHWKCDRCGPCIERLLAAKFIFAKPGGPAPAASPAAAVNSTEASPAVAAEEIKTEGAGGAAAINITPASPIQSPPAPTPTPTLAPAPAPAPVPAPVRVAPPPPPPDVVAPPPAPPVAREQREKDDGGLSIVAGGIMMAIFALVVRRIWMHWDVITGL